MMRAASYTGGAHTSSITQQQQQHYDPAGSTARHPVLTQQASSSLPPPVAASGQQATAPHHPSSATTVAGAAAAAGSAAARATLAPAPFNQPTTTSLPAAATSVMTGSLGLDPYRRHAATLSGAVPLRTTASGAPPAAGFSYQEGGGRNHTSSWGNGGSSESPKKLRQSFTTAPRGRSSNSYFGRLVQSMEDSKFLNQKIVRNNKKEFAGWFMLFALIVVGYKFFSDGSFSAILTLASAFQCFSMVLLNLKVISQQSAAGISQRTVMLIIICLVFRLVSTLFYNGYLPVDRSGDWLYQGADVMSALLGMSLLAYARKYCTSSIQLQRDKDTCAVVIPIVVAAVLAVAVHPTLNQNVIADTAWTFALYLETFAMVPQLFMMVNLGGEVEALTSHYVASMAASKVFSILFWYFSFAELAPRHGGWNLAGWAVLLSYSAQTLLFADFFYYYIKSIRVGRQMILNF